MEEPGKRILVNIKNNLPSLYMFARLMSGEEETAENLLIRFMNELREGYKNSVDDHDMKTRLFGLFYTYFLKQENRGKREPFNESYEHLEDFYLYTRLEEAHIHDQKEKLDLISNIHKNDMERIIAGLPVFYRPYLILVEIFDFSYPQISYILDVPMDTVSQNLGVARRMFQSGLWDALRNKRPYLTTASLFDES